MQKYRYFKFTQRKAYIEDKNIQIKKQTCEGFVCWRCGSMPVKIKVITNKVFKVEVKVKRPKWQQFLHY